MSLDYRWNRPLGSQSTNAGVDHDTSGKESACINLETGGPSIDDSRLFRKKRRFEEADGRIGKHIGSIKQHNTLAGPKYKRTRTPKISGQKLPVSRLVEVLDRESLQNLLQTLFQQNPEIINTVDRVSPKPGVKECVELLKQKFDCIMAHLPYKCDMESDYSYMRVKPYLNEFLNCLSDFILNFLPPTEQNCFISFKFLDESSELIHKLPNFSNSEFQYTKLMAYEQLTNTWLIVINHCLKCDDSFNPHGGNAVSPGDVAVPSSPSPVSSSTTQHSECNVRLVKIVNSLNLREKLVRHNSASRGKFKVVIECIDTEIENYERFNHTLNNGNGVLSDLITVDYSNFSLAARTSH